MASTVNDAAEHPCSVMCLIGADGRGDRDGQLFQASKGEFERPCGVGVDPLDVIERKQDGSRIGQGGDERDQTRTDCSRVRRFAPGLLEQQRNECPRCRTPN